MNTDIKIEAEKIAEEVINGTVEQACYDFESLIGNYQFQTSSNLEKSFLSNLGAGLAKHVRKSPKNFLIFTHDVWEENFEDSRPVLGNILAALENLNPEEIIPAIVKMCESAETEDDVDTLVSGFEPVILKNPDQYLPLLKRYMSNKNPWVKRLIIITCGHMMFRHKSSEITKECLEIMRPVITSDALNLRKVVSWIIGSFGVRSEQNEVADFFISFKESKKPTVVSTFAEALRRTKISLQPEISQKLIPIFENWKSFPDDEMKKNAEYALRILNA